MEHSLLLPSLLQCPPCCLTDPSRALPLQMPEKSHNNCHSYSFYNNDKCPKINIVSVACDLVALTFAM